MKLGDVTVAVIVSVPDTLDSNCDVPKVSALLMLSTVQISTSSAVVSFSLYAADASHTLVSPRELRMMGLVLAIVPACVVYVASGVVVPAA